MEIGVPLAQGDPSAVVFFGMGIIAAFLLLFSAFWLGWWWHSRPPTCSPYSGMPLRLASQLSYYQMERTLRYIYTQQTYENQLFEFRKASFCRETGRIFVDSITWYNAIDVDWSFISKRYPGNYVSWGSLNSEQQAHIRQAHESLEGFQTEYSSKMSSPRAVEPKFAMMKPGPLYVDVTTSVLVGWKIVPDTTLEVLLVQKPKRTFSLTPHGE